MTNKKGNALIIIVILIVIVAVGVLGYLGRHKIKSMLGMSAPTPEVTTAPVTNTNSPTNQAPTNNIYMTKSDATKGNYMTDFQGMTLYTFDKDSSGVSNCYDNCAKAWPPYTSGATAQGSFPEGITVITRTDGTKQFAWKNMPLYYFASDSKAGDLNGDGVGGTWHIIKL